MKNLHLKPAAVFLIAILIFTHSMSGDAFIASHMAKSTSRKDYLITAKMVPPATRTADADMGWSIAISEDESTMVVGAPIDSYDLSGANYLHASGSVDVYIKSSGTWVFQQKLIAPTRHAEANFGASVGISSDTIVVGAWGETLDESNANSLTEAGAAYVYTRSGSTWSFQKKLIGSGTNGRMANDQYGYSVAINSGTIVVGAWYQDYDASGGGGYVNAAGAVFIYTGSGSSWTLQQRVVAAAGTGGRVAESRFGNSVSISGDTVLVGSVNHTLDATGANSLSDAGAAYVLTRTAGVWSQQAKLVGTGNNGRNASDNFGRVVSISGDTAVITAIFQSYSSNGTNSVTNAGAAYVFTRSGSTWSFQQKLTAFGNNGRIASDYFGLGVAISGNTIVVSTPYHIYDSQGANSVASAGAAFVFTRRIATWNPAKVLVGTGTNGRVAGDEFGYSVAITGDTIAVGARLQDYDSSGANSVSNSGAVFIFNKNTP